MRAFYDVVFDDIVQSTTPVYTDPVFNGLLGSADKLAFQVISNVFSGGPSLTVAVEHSGDEQTWTQRSISAEIDRVSLSWTDTNNHVASYDAAGSTGCRVRFRIEIGGSSIVRVKIIACGRTHRSWHRAALGLGCQCQPATDSPATDDGDHMPGDDDEDGRAATLRASDGRAPATNAAIEDVEADELPGWSGWRPPVILAGPTLRAAGKHRGPPGPTETMAMPPTQGATTTGRGS